jgi:hypothetical protein
MAERWEKCRNDRERTGGARRKVRKWWLFRHHEVFPFIKNVRKHYWGQGFAPLGEEYSFRWVNGRLRPPEA